MNMKVVTKINIFHKQKLIASLHPLIFEFWNQEQKIILSIT